MTGHHLPDGVEAQTAAEALVVMKHPTFLEWLDTYVEMRIGQLLEKVDDGYTAQEALLGKTVNLRPVLLTQTEIRIIRLRCKLKYVRNQKNLAKETLGHLQESLWRVGRRQLLENLGIMIGVKSDDFGKNHIVFIPIP